MCVVPPLNGLDLSLPRQVDPTTAEMLKAMNLTATVNSVTIQQAGPAKPAFQGGDRRGKQ